MREMMTLREAMNRVFDDTFGRSLGQRAVGQGSGIAVPVDVYETNDRLVVRASLPGMKPDDVDISITNNTLTIKGEFRDEEERERDNVYVLERCCGAFQRSVILPPNLDTEDIAARAKDGVLTIEIPKTEEAKPKRISIKAA